MKNFVHDGAAVTVPAPTGGVTSGGLAVIGALAGVAVTTAEAGADVALHTRGVFDLAKVSADDLSLGETVYAAAGVDQEVGADGGSWVPVGVAVEAAGAGVTTVRVRLNG